MISLYLGPAMLQDVDRRWRQQQRQSPDLRRADVLRALIQAGLQAQPTEAA